MALRRAAASEITVTVSRPWARLKICTMVEIDQTPVKFGDYQNAPHKRSKVKVLRCTTFISDLPKRAVTIPYLNVDLIADMLRVSQ
jgi:hypothetical protein